jgi:hypothetical protein
MSGKNLIGVIAALTLITSTMWAGVIPGRWEKVDGLTSGTEITVKLQAGDRIDCAFKSSGPEDLILIELGGSERRIPKFEVLKITRREKYDDFVGDGAVIGLGVGATFGLVVAAIAYADCGHAAYFAVGPLVYGGIGAGIGVVADALHKGNEVLYKAR